jgi:hypothetical protein
MRTTHITSITKREETELGMTYAKFARHLDKMPSISSLRNGEHVTVDDGTNLLLVVRRGNKLLKATMTEVV